MFITATIQSIVSGTPTAAGRSTGAEERKREVVDPDAEEGRDRGGDELAGELAPRREHAEVVDRADDGRDRRAEQHSPRFPAELEERQRRHEDPEEEREPAEPRDRVDVQPPALRPVDDAEEPGHAPHRRRQQDHDHERDGRAVENLGVSPEARSSPSLLRPVQPVACVAQARARCSPCRSARGRSRRTRCERRDAPRARARSLPAPRRGRRASPSALLPPSPRRRPPRSSFRSRASGRGRSRHARPGRRAA